MNNSSLSKSMVGRLYWLAKLRWLAVAGVIITVFFISRLENVSLPVHLLYMISGVLAASNILFFRALSWMRKKSGEEQFLLANILANLQISSDLTCLALLLHFSGGVDNPFMLYFIFHVIIASILLTRRAAYLQISYAVFLFCAMVGLEYLGVLRHYPITAIMGCRHSDNLVYIVGVTAPFILTLYIAGYMTTSLSSRLRRREKGLYEANNLLREKDRLKSEYVLRVSHDIKGHLAAIQSCIGPVVTGISGPLNAEQEDMIRRADDRTGKLLKFVKALLNITHIKLGKEMTRETFSLKEMLSETIHETANVMKKKDIILKYEIKEDDIQITGARVFLQESVYNILMNAIKYTPNGGKISLNVKDIPGSVLLEIKDTGIGIPEKDILKVFDDFFRAPNARATEEDGTGLGLSIVKQIIERHNGEVWVESVEGKGSCFIVRLPK